MKKFMIFTNLQKCYNLLQNLNRVLFSAKITQIRHNGDYMYSFFKDRSLFKTIFQLNIELINIIVQIGQMNILSNEQMKAKERKLLEYYQHGDLKLTINVQELIESKSNQSGMYCFNKPTKQIKTWVKKLVPLSKRIRSISLQQEQNALFKVITYTFLLTIYKSKGQINTYIKDQIRCSLYSDDIDLLEIRNHSFNKKMHSDKIKAIMAHLFKEIQYLSATSLIKQNSIEPQDILLYILDKNDILSEGFHLFFRNILSKLEVQNAQNCIAEVAPQQAISNLVEYFDINCRIFNQLYLFNDDGVFISEIAEEALIFGKYYQNQIDYKESQGSGQQEEQSLENNFNLNFASSNKSSSVQRTMLKQDDVIEGKDVKIFNFLLDTDRNQDDSEMSARPSYNQNTPQTQTPSFVSNQQYKFGKKRSIQEEQGKENSDSSFNNIKDRILNEKINQIQSQEQEGNQNAFPNQTPTPFLGGVNLNNNFSFQPNGGYNKVLNFNNTNSQDDDQGQYFQEDNQASTPMLGGGEQFNFGQKKNTARDNYQTQNPVAQKDECQSQFRDSLQLGAQRGGTQDWGVPLTKQIQKKEVRESAIRRQSMQYQNSSKSKSSTSRKLQMKSSKNQIKVIDQTASRTSLYHEGQSNRQKGKLKTEQDSHGKTRKQTLGYCQNLSSISSCTCTIIKQNRIKIQSQIIEVTYQRFSKQEGGSLLAKMGKQINPIEEELNFKKPINHLAKYDFKTDSNARNAIKDSSKAQIQQKYISTENKQMTGSQKTDSVPDKRKQFLQFLKKDKRDLIKKITQKRTMKNNFHQIDRRNFNKTTHNHKYQMPSNKISAQNKKFVKQSMFVGTSPTNQNSYNPQHKLGQQSNRTKNKTISPSNSIGKVRDSRRQSNSKVNSRTINSFERSSSKQKPSQKSVTISFNNSSDIGRGFIKSNQFNANQVTTKHNITNPNYVQLERNFGVNFHSNSTNILKQGQNYVLPPHPYGKKQQSNLNGYAIRQPTSSFSSGVAMNNRYGQPVPTSDVGGYYNQYRN